MILIAFSAKAVYDNPCLTFIEPKPGLKPHVEIHNTTLMKLAIPIKAWRTMWNLNPDNTFKKIKNEHVQTRM